MEARRAENSGTLVACIELEKALGLAATPRITELLGIINASIELGKYPTRTSSRP